MYQFPIGAMLGSFRLPFREAVEKAASLGIQGLQISMTGGDMAPEVLTPEKVKELNDIQVQRFGSFRCVRRFWFRLQ